MKVRVKYPQIVINTIEVDIPESEIVEDMSFDEKFDLVIKYAKNLPSYDEPDYNLCKSFSELNTFQLFPLIDQENEIDFQSCDECDNHDSCEDFGCAIKSGIR